MHVGGKRRGPLATTTVVATLVALACLIGCASSGQSLKPARKDGPLRHYQLARVYFEQGRVQEALSELDRSLRLDDELPQTHFFLGYVRWKLEHYGQAEEAFRRALELNPLFTDARMYLAECLEQEGRADEALVELSAALSDASYPNPEKIYFNRAMIHNRQGKLSAALDDLRQAVKVRPRYYRAHFEMGVILEDGGREAEALRAYQAAEPGFHRDARFLLRYGKALFRAGRSIDAARLLRKVIELAPGTEEATQASEYLGVIG